MKPSTVVVPRKIVTTTGVVDALGEKRQSIDNKGSKELDNIVTQIQLFSDVVNCKKYQLQGNRSKK